MPGVGGSIGRLESCETDALRERVQADRRLADPPDQTDESLGSAGPSAEAETFSCGTSGI